jgi:hypothetical protein
MTEGGMTEGSPSAAPESVAALPPPPPPPPPRKRGAGPALLVLLILVLGLVAGSPYWAPPIIGLLPWGARAPQATPQLAGLEARVAAAEAARRNTEERLQKLEAQIQATTRLPPALASLDARVTALERRPAAEDSGAAVAPLRDALGQMTTRLDALDARLGQLAAAEARNEAKDDGAQRSLLVAVAELRAVMMTAQPFVNELAAVRALGHGNAEVEDALRPLTATAATGIPTIAGLAARFRAETAPAILHAGAPAAMADASWVDQILARLRALVVIRRVGESGAADSDPAAAAVNGATTALARDDLAGAIASLQHLTGPAAQAAAPWLDLARLRHDADAALSALAGQIAARLAAGEQR